MTTPDWLTQRDGALRPGLNPSIRLVMLSGHPQYKLMVVPSQGQFACAITQTVNGKRLDSGAAVQPTIEAALTTGLEELRVKLGW